MIANFPEINIKETINVENQINISNIKVASVLPTNSNKIDSMIPVPVNDVRLFETLFGTPTAKNYKFWYNIYNFLQYNTDGIYVIKPANSGDRNYYKAYSSGTPSDGSYIDIYNKELAEKVLYSTISDDIQFVNRSVTNSEDIAVAMCSDSDNYTTPITDEKIPNIVDYNTISVDKSDSHNNTWFIKKESMTEVKKIDNTNFVFSGNLTSIIVDQKIEIDSTLYNVESIESNAGKLGSVTNVDGTGLIVTISGEYKYLIIGDVIKDSEDVEYTISDVSFSAGDTLLTVDNTGIEVDDTIVVGSDTTSIEIDSAIAGSITDIFYVIGDLSTQLLNLSDSIYKKAVWTTSWTISDITDGYYYVTDSGLVVSVASGVITESTIQANYLNTNQSVMAIYNNFYTNGDISSFSSLLSNEPDWDNGEFAIAIFEKINDLFEFKEVFVVKADETNEYKIFQESKYIYMITNKSPQTTNTNSLSIEDITIQVQTSDDYSDITYFNTDTLLEINNVYSNTDKYNIEFFIGYQYVDGNKLMDIPISFSNVNKRSVTVISPWEESEYLGNSTSEKITKLLNNFGNNIFTTKKVTNYNSYCAIYNNMKLQEDLYSDDNLWLPIIGDIVGLLVENATDPSISGEGYEIKNAIQLMVDVYDYEDLKKLNRNGINTVGYSVDKTPIIRDSITATKELDSLLRELYIRRISNNIKGYINRSYYVYLLQIINVENIIAMTSSLQNYINSISSVESSIVEPAFDGDVVTFNIEIKFYKKIRTINFNIIINNNKIEINE